MNQAIVTVRKSSTRYTLENVINVVYTDDMIIITTIGENGELLTYTYSGDSVYITIC